MTITPKDLTTNGRPATATLDHAEAARVRAENARRTAEAARIKLLRGQHEAGLISGRELIAAYHMGEAS
jgi:hypothetical protein